MWCFLSRVSAPSVSEYPLSQNHNLFLWPLPFFLLADIPYRLNPNYFLFRQIYSWVCFHQDRNKSKTLRLILGLFSVSIKSLRSLNNAYKEILLPREFCTSCERTIVSHLTPRPGQGIIHLNTAV